MALDQHGVLLKMVVIVSQHHLTGRLCWSWLSWFICLSTRLWASLPSAQKVLLKCLYTITVARSARATTQPPSTGHNVVKFSVRKRAQLQATILDTLI